MSKIAVWQQVEREFKRYGLKDSSVKPYSQGLKRFCQHAKINPHESEQKGLETIEDLTADFIADNREVLAPKYLNVTFNAIKR